MGERPSPKLGRAASLCGLTANDNEPEDLRMAKATIYIEREFRRQQRRKQRKPPKHVS